MLPRRTSICGVTSSANWKRGASDFSQHSVLLTKQEVKTRQSIVDLFLARFTLSVIEANALLSSNVPVGPKFLAAMDRAQAICDDRRVLMVGEDSPSKAGLDIMAVTVAHLEKAYDKLVRWCSSEFRSMAGAAMRLSKYPTSSAKSRAASAHVQSSSRASPSPLPPYHTHHKPPLTPSEALPMLAQTRQSATLSSLTSALTTGSASGRSSTRPIELHAHDALRYTGDMLAWVHQAIAAERVFLETRLGIDAGARMLSAVRAPARAADEWLLDLTYIVDTLAPHARAARKRGAVHVQVEARVRELINEHYEDVLRDSGLHDAVRACEHTAPDVPLSLVPACTPSALRAALSAFAH
ncbi:oligomeric complex COG6-domain-containing protein [Lactarius quietus]|nr:oligomeric complex COG6-domain-containing protein [Lactarius quietus]